MYAKSAGVHKGYFWVGQALNEVNWKDAAPQESTQPGGQARSAVQSQALDLDVLDVLDIVAESQ